MRKAPDAAEGDKVTRDANGRGDRRLDLAARAAWLYYVGNKTQDEIAGRLDVSRQGAQRLVALARSAGLVKFRIDHPIGSCSDLAERLIARYGLKICDVVPSAGGERGGLENVAVAAAARLDGVLARQEPLTVATGSGRTLRAMVQQVSSLDRPQHRIVSLIGNLNHAGRAGPYEVSLRLADLTNAQCYPSPLPVICADAAEASRMRDERSFRLLADLVREAQLCCVGVGGFDAAAPLHVDGFIDAAELESLRAAGAVGEICGWAFDVRGRLIEGLTNARLTSQPLEMETKAIRLGLAAGPRKVRPVLAALAGGLLHGLITDEETARAVLAA